MLEPAGPDRPDAARAGRDVGHAAGPGAAPGPSGGVGEEAAGQVGDEGGGGAVDGFAAGAPSTTFVRAALRPRMLVLLLVLLAAAAVCARLGVWQLDRAEIRGASEAAERRAEQAAAEPVGIGTVLQPQTTFRGELVGQHVRARGVYEPAGQLLVEDRVLDGRTGYLVLTPLRVHDPDPRESPAAGEGAGDDVGTPSAGPGPTRSGGTAAPAAGAEPAGAGDPVLPVVRGWVADPGDAAALAVPEGEVTVSGYLQSSEGAGDAAAAGGRTDAISSAALVNAWGGPIWSGYVVLTRSDPGQGDALAQLPPPTRSGSGLNVQNLAYAAQWWIFGGFALVLWIRMVRDEARGGVPGMPDDAPRAPGPEPGAPV